MAIGISLIPIWAQAQSADIQNQTDTTKIKKQMNIKANIGKITVPQAAIQEFKKQASVTPIFLKSLPGYIKGEYYEMYDEAGNLHLISVVVWEDETYYRNAQMELKKYYEQIHFNRAEFVKRLNVSIEYGAYDATEMK